MNKQERINNIIKDMVTVNITESDLTKDKSNLFFSYKADPRLQKLIGQSIGKYRLDWPADIIRDEVIATFYESMLLIAKMNNMTIEEIDLENGAFVGSVYNMSVLRLKKTLIPLSKQVTKDKAEAKMSEIAVSQLGTDNKGIPLTIEKILEGTTELNITEEEEIQYNHFINWFLDNKQDILTKRQLAYLDGDIEHKDKDKARYMRRRIEKRTIAAYNNKYSNILERNAELLDKKEVIEFILEAEDFRKALTKHWSKNYIIDTIMDNVSTKAAISFNKGSNDAEVIKEYRIALFKALGKIIDKIEATGINQ